MRLSQAIARPIRVAEEIRFQQLRQSPHCLGALPGTGRAPRYVATRESERLAWLSFSAAALKCGARDRWIGRDFRHRYDRLNLIANHSRRLIPPRRHHQNPASKALSLCQRRIQTDWAEGFGYSPPLPETLVGPTRRVGTIYRAADWR